MLQKFAILGLVLLLAGGAVLGWLYQDAQNERRQAQSLASPDTPGSQEYIEKYGRWYQLSPEQQTQLALELDQERKSKTAAQLDREQQARLTADLDKLAAGQMHPGDIADFLYGRGWESRVEEYKTHRAQRQTAHTVALACLFMGGFAFAAATILGLLRQMVRLIQAARQRAWELEPEPESDQGPLIDLEPHDAEPPEDPEALAPPEQPRQRRRVLARAETAGESRIEPSAGLESFFVSSATPSSGMPQPAPGLQPVPQDSGVAVLLADEQSAEGEWSPQDQWSFVKTREIPSRSGVPEPRTAWPSSRQSPDEVSTVEKSLKEQAEDLQKQIAEFKQVAQHVQQATRERPEPLGDTLKELTQQVSAIREYAASQQDRVEKLQDGYDWGIIRTFCLRVIRCLDNLEGRLADLSKDDGGRAYLEEIRDELLFALESSGVEQFRPELNSEFHGQERLAEALKEKQPAKKPDQAGKIARVIRPGYRYLVDDENYRVVRTAQVKLYG